MRLLLDTHVLLWWVADDRRLSRATRELLTSPSHDVAVSAVSFWEIAIKKSLDRIDVDLNALRAAATEDHFDQLPITVSHTLQLEELPPLHRDPFDRLLIAQSIWESRQLITRDDAIHAYAGISGFAVSRA